MTWDWNKDYRDLEQVAPFFDAYMAVYEELAAAGKYPYNDEFKGRIPGIEGEREDTAIYLLQGLRRKREIDAKVTAFEADGYVWIDEIEETTKFAHVVLVPDGRTDGLYHEFSEARLIRNPYRKDSLAPYAVIPKGKRTHGHPVSGRRVLAKATA